MSTRRRPASFASASDGGLATAGKVTWPAVDIAAGTSITRTFTVNIADALKNKVKAIINDGFRADATGGFYTTGSPVITSIADPYAVSVSPATQTDGARVGAADGDATADAVGAALGEAAGEVLTEALACGLPLLMVDVTPGQEEGNAEYVVKNGLGYLAETPIDALEHLYHWLHDPSLLSKFQRIQRLNTKFLELMAGMDRALGGEYIFDRAFLESSVRELTDHVYQVVYSLNALSQNRHLSLFDRYLHLRATLEDILSGGFGPLAAGWDTPSGVSQTPPSGASPPSAWSSWPGSPTSCGRPWPWCARRGRTWRTASSGTPSRCGPTRARSGTRAGAWPTWWSRSSSSRASPRATRATPSLHGAHPAAAPCGPRQ